MSNAVRVLAFLPLLMPTLADAQEAKTTAQVKVKARPSIYDVKLDARAQVVRAAAIAKRDNQRLLVMFGGDWCGWCHKLHDTFQQNRDISKILREDYQLVMVDTKAPNAEALLKECQGDLKQMGYPFLAVLDADGKIITRQETDALEEGDHHDPKKVRDFLSQWAPEKQEAAKVLKVAMDRASSEDKRVFVHFGAPWCGWCHKLDNFLAREEIAKVMGKDFIDVKIDVDRMIGGKDIEAKFRKNPGEGIPWFVILDAKGEAIGNADGPNGNIGYPAAPDEISHFLKMLRKAARKSDAADFELIEKTLKDAPEAKIKAR